MPTTPRTTLRNYPETAKNVGLVVADYAVLEAFMAIVYACMAPEPPAEAFERFYTLRSMHLKEELANKAAAALPPPVLKAHERLWKRMKNAANRRTEIAHCIFFDHGEGPMRTRIVAGVPHYDKLTDQLFSHTFSQFYILGEDILAFAAIAADHLGRDPHIVNQLPISPRAPETLVSKPARDPLTPRETNPTIEAIRRLGLANYYELGLLEEHGRIPPPPQPRKKNH